MNDPELIRRLRRALVRKARRRAGARGVTLIEVLIVIAIMALIAGGVGFAILPKYKQAQIDTARTNAKKIRAVAIQYIALKGGDCPTVETLIAERELEGDGAQDPWGKPYTILCNGDDVGVVSSGPDGQEGTEDDIAVGDIAES